MIRSPLPEWQWRYLPENDRLALQLAPDELFITAYQGKKLTITKEFCQSITLEQTGEYHDFASDLTQSFTDLPEPVIFHMVVHAVAARNFHKSIANKSWLFKTMDDALLLPPVVSLQTEMDEGIALTLENEGGFATLMLLSEQLQINAGKSFNRYDLIKTNVNTLSSSVSPELFL